MISFKEILDVIEAIVPLFVTMILGYFSVRWWKLFTPEQCAGIGRFIRIYAIPFLSFQIVSSNNFYAINLKLFAADSLEKIVILTLLFVWNAFSRHSSIDWVITFFSLACLPNTLIVGIPLGNAMYGVQSNAVMVQTVVFQGLIWIPILLALFEYKGAMLLIKEKFPKSAEPVSSFGVDSGVHSRNRVESLQAKAETQENGELQVVVRKSSGGSSDSSPRASNLTGVEIYSVQSPAGISSRTSSFSHLDLSLNGSVNGSQNPCLNHASSVHAMELAKPRFSVSMDEHSRMVENKRKEDMVSDNDQHHLPQNSAPSSFASAANGSQPKRAIDSMTVASTDPVVVSDTADTPSCKADAYGVEKAVAESNLKKQQKRPPASEIARLILLVVCKRLMKNPNTYSSILGLAWSMIAFRWHVKLPSVLNRCISMISDTSLALAMFNLGSFMGSQPKLIACRISETIVAMAARFLVGPAVTAATSSAVGLRGVVFHTAVIQAALPQAIMAFVFAKEYNVHPEILSTSVTVGMVIAVPVVLAYYAIMG